MIVTDITKQKRKDRYNIFIDGSFYSGIGALELVKSGIKIGAEVSSEKLERVVLESEKRLAFDKALGLLSKQVYSKHDIKNKLINYGFAQDCIDYVLKKLEEYGYINDKEYAKMLVNSKKTKSKLEIKQILFQKGISSHIADKEVQTISIEEEKKRTKALAEKYMKNKVVDQKSMAGLYAYLSRKGFSSESVMACLRYYKYDVEE